MRCPTARHVLPEMTERDRDGVRPTDPYSKLLEERIVLVGTPLDDACVSDVITQLIHLEYTAPDRPISLYINSPGGSFTAMTALYDAMNFVSCEIETVCLGQAVSVAAVVLAAGAPGRRLALPGARIVLRQPARAEALQGQPDDLAIFARELSRARETLELLLARHTGQQRDQVSQDVERDTVLDAAGAVGYGLIDQIAGPRQRYGRLGLKG